MDKYCPVPMNIMEEQFVLNIIVLVPNYLIVISLIIMQSLMEEQFISMTLIRVEVVFLSTNVISLII